MTLFKPNLTQPDDDPFLELEEVSGARALNWVAAQNRNTLAKFGGSRIAGDAAALKAILDRPDRIPFVRRRSGRLYNFWQDENNPRGLIRRTSMESYRTDSPSWDVMLDIDELAKSEGEDWVYAGAASLPGSDIHVILSLSRGGSDAVVMREFNRDTGKFVEGGFQVPEAKGSVVWIDKDTLLLTSAIGGDEFVTIAGYSRTVRLWKRGVPWEAAKTIFEIDRSHMGVWCGIDHRHPDKPAYILDHSDFFNVEIHTGQAGGELQQLDLPRGVSVEFDNDLMTVKPREAWSVGGRSYAADTLLAISRSAFLDGNREFTTIFEPAARKALQSFAFVNGKLLLHYKDNLENHFEAYDSNWQRLPFAELPATGSVSVMPFDAEPSDSNGDLLISINDPVTPPTLSFCAKGSTLPVVLKRTPSFFDAKGLNVTRHEAVSPDGERIPYVQIGPEDASGNSPVHMTGYGGFGLSEEATYNAAMGKLWLEQGGTCVIAHIRGGGEFGTPWHDAGRLAGKAKSHDDFAAIAEDLVKRGVTIPARIAAEGGSNGGLLIANMLVRYPERFGALFCTIPLTDMRRYTKLLAGASWMAEYGDPEKVEDWAFMEKFSAYHLAEPGKSYPPILIASSKADDRVHPGHGRKLTAKLQAMGYAAFYYEPATGGHSYGKDSTEKAEFMALGVGFLKAGIGFQAH
jgi:prolyl oligopeptidase